MPNQMSATFRVPPGESGLSRVFAAVNAVDPRLQRFALHVFRGSETRTQIAGPRSAEVLLPGPNAAVSMRYKHYFLHEKPPVFSDCGPLSASFATGGKAPSETPFWVIAVYIPGGMKPFPRAPEKASVAAMLALEDMVYCFGPEMPRRLCSSISYMSTACDRIMPVDARELIPYLHEPRWSLDRLPMPLGRPTSKGSGLLELMVNGRLDLPGVSYEPLTHKDLEAMQRMIFSAYARCVDSGPFVHWYFAGNSCATFPSREAKMTRHPTVGHWLDHEIRIPDESVARPTLEMARPDSCSSESCGTAMPAAGQTGINPPALSNMRGHIGDMIKAYAVEHFLSDLWADEREVWPEVDELLFDRGLLSEILSTVDDIDCDTAYEFGSAP